MLYSFILYFIHDLHTYRRFTRPEIAVFLSRSFRAVLFFLLTKAEIRAFSRLKTPISAEVSKKKKRTARKKPVERTTYSG